MFTYVKADKPAVASVEAVSLVLTSFTPAMEEAAKEYASRYSHVAALPFSPKAAVESQELDHSAELAALDEVRDTIDKFNEEHPYTGASQVYMLDGEQTAYMDPEGNQTAMRALVTAALNNKSKVIAALLPTDTKVSHLGQIPMALTLRQLGESMVSMENVTVLVGKAAFESFLKDPEGYAPEG